ncbi:MAG: hypothetical protein FJZ58_01305, partial [Chlamydiae bacterium]|nr:hypothetical protein [Chlamydiota bacterium]
MTYFLPYLKEVLKRQSVSFDILAPTTSILGPHFLEASAGTGKTFAIEHLIPRLLLEAKEPLHIGEILIVTFTRAATRELKARVYQTLLLLREALIQGEGGPAYLQPFLTCEKWLTTQSQHRIEEAIQSFSSASIFTLHSFCLCMLQEFALETEFLVTASLEEESKIKKWLVEGVKDTLRTSLPLEEMGVSQLRRVVKHVGRDIEVLCQEIIK